MKNVICAVAWAIVLSVALQSCNGKDDGQAEAPAIYHDIVSSYENELRITTIERCAGYTYMVFTDGLSLRVEDGDLFIFDCTINQPIEPVLKDGHWFIGSKDTGVAKSEEGNPHLCLPVYAFFNGTVLSLFISNGDRLDIPLETDTNRPLVSFAFLAKNNPQLQHDVKCAIIGYTVKGAFPSSVKLDGLVPTFVFSGRSLEVAGVKQVSSESRHDFNAPVTYVATLSDGTKREYVVELASARTMPTVYLTTEGGAPIVDKENYVSGTMVVDDPDLTCSDVEHLELPVQLKGRGNTSWTMPKKPYRVKMESKNSVLGMPKDKNWALLANYSDKTLLRNMVAMEMSRIVGFSWTPQMKCCNLYLNGSYDGLYTVSEHKAVAKHKVNISPVGPEDNEGSALTGDYYFEIDGSQDEACSFWTSVGIPVMVSDPEDPTEAQRAYVKQLFKDFETALYADNFKDPTEGYRKYIDVESFIKFYIVQELSKNVDGNLRKSTFITKTRGGKMEMYHVWDFDIAFGNCNYMHSTWAGVTDTYEGWFVKDYINSGKSDGWYGRMFKDPAFVQEVKDMWNSVVGDLRQIPGFIDYNVALLSGAQDKNFVRWNILGKKVWPNIDILYTYDAEVEYLKTFYSQRLEWLDKAIKTL